MAALPAMPATYSQRRTRWPKAVASLFDGARVSKADPRVVAYGTVDELNAVVAWARAGAPHERVRSTLERLMNEMFTVGADLATPLSAKRATQRVTTSFIDRLE